MSGTLVWGDRLGQRGGIERVMEGKQYPALSFVVEDEHVRRFAAAVGDDGRSCRRRS
jgi:hypothetical protein